MPSFVWNREVDEAYSEPYEYGGQDQFVRESTQVLELLKKHYSKRNQIFTCTEQTLEKAIWMLQLDGLEALNDALLLIGEKKHRIAVRLFRDTVETLDISEYLFNNSKNSKKDLEKWYENEVVPHRRYRDWVKNNHGKELSENAKDTYSDLSKYTHRTYRALGLSYIKGHNDMLVYDGFEKSDILILPQTISCSYALVAKLIKRFIDIAERTKQLNRQEINSIWKKCLEEETVPRRFGTGPGQIRRGPLINIVLDDKT